MTDIIWLHEDALRDTHPVFDQAPEDARAVFVWDKAYFKDVGYSFKRLVFIYETLTTLPVDIVCGDIVTVLSNALAGEDSARLYIPATPNPYLNGRMGALAKKFSVEVVDDIPFVTLDKSPDLKRFFRYWKTAEDKALKKNGGSSGAARD